MTLPFFRLLGYLLLPWAAIAQELPPPGGWPLRTVAVLRAVPEPPGGLIPYRQGKLWGFADTTGRVWIRPVFTTEPPRFGAGLLLQAQQKRKSEEARPDQARANRFSASWNIRYGQLAAGNGRPYSWALSFEEPAQAGPAWLLNAHGEQLLTRPAEAIALAPDGSWCAVRRPAQPTTQRELVAIETRELGSDWQRPGQVFTVPLGPQAPAVPPRLLRHRAYDPDVNFTTSLGNSPPLYLARKVNWLRPQRLVLRHGRCGDSRLVKALRYRHQGQQAVFDARGHRLTDYRYTGLKPLLPQRLAYWHATRDQFGDEYAADSSGLPARWRITEDVNGPARRYGLLDRRGRELTPALYARIEAVGPNSLWVVAVAERRLLYGLVDTLGRYQLPLGPQPLSLPDAAGLLRRRSSAPLHLKDEYASYLAVPQYPDTATVQYLRPDGRLAFAGRFEQADAFWQGRAVVRQGNTYGLLDTLGRWVLPPQPDRLSYFAYTSAHYDQWQATDPLGVFDHLDGASKSRGGGWNGDRPGEVLLLQAQGSQGYGLRDGRTGQVVVPAVFDERPEHWQGGVAGQRKGQPLGYSFRGQAFAPNVPASYPPGVLNPAAIPSAWHPPLLRTENGWRTRGGRCLWLD